MKCPKCNSEMTVKNPQHLDPLWKCNKKGCELNEFFNRQSKIGVSNESVCVHDNVRSSSSTNLQSSGVSQ